MKELINVETQRTTRNLLMASGVTVFAMLYDLKFHQLDFVSNLVRKGTEKQTVEAAIIVGLCFLVASHLVNWTYNALRTREPLETTIALPRNKPVAQFILFIWFLWFPVGLTIYATYLLGYIGPGVWMFVATALCNFFASESPLAARIFH